VIDTMLLDRAEEVGELVAEKAFHWTGSLGIVGGGLSLGDPEAEMPFILRLYLDCDPYLVADQLPATISVELADYGTIEMPVVPEYTGEFRG